MIELSDDAARLDRARIYGWLTTSYWSPGIARAQVDRQIDGSHCIGAYLGGEQIGFTRTISDRASFAWIADVWVDDPARGQGVGRRMVQWFLDHPEYATVRRFALVTADAHGVYAANGFQPLLRSERYMERLSPEFTALLKTAP